MDESPWSLGTLFLLFLIFPIFFFFFDYLSVEVYEIYREILSVSVRASLRFSLHNFFLIFSLPNTPFSRIFVE